MEFTLKEICVEPKFRKMENRGMKRKQTSVFQKGQIKNHNESLKSFHTFLLVLIGLALAKADVGRVLTLDDWRRLYCSGPRTLQSSFKDQVRL